MCYEYSNSFLLAFWKSIIVGYIYNTMLQNMRNYYTYPTASYACYLLLLHFFSPILSLTLVSTILFFILRLVCSFQTHFCVSVAGLLNIMSTTVLSRLLQMTEFLFAIVVVAEKYFILHWLHPLIQYRLLPYLGHCEQCCNGNTGLFWTYYFSCLVAVYSMVGLPAGTTVLFLSKEHLKNR